MISDPKTSPNHPVAWVGRQPDDEDGQGDACPVQPQGFSQDLFFQETDGTENFQTRYIITHPATGDLSCPEGKKYLYELKERRKDELEMLTYLTGRGAADWDL